VTGPNGSVYRVVLSGQVENKLRQPYRKAKADGQGKSFLASVKRIVARLRTDPLEFGQIRFRLRHIGLEVRVAVVPPMTVIYGVHAERRLALAIDQQIKIFQNHGAAAR
jgi:hypothetical protein